MRVFVMVCLVLGLGLVASPALAQEAEALRQELEQLKQQLQLMQQQYQKTIQDMTDRLQRLEAQPAVPPPSPAAGAPAPPAPVATGAPATAPRPSSQLSALDLARPREPFALYERRGHGQLLFDMGVTGDFAGSLTSKRVEQARVGSLQGEENRVFPREIEVSFFGQIDPYARAEVRVEAGDELEEDGTRSLGVELAEANLTLMAIPWGFQPKGGRMRLRWGYLNEFHQHDRPFIDNPNVYVRFFGEEGLVENGAEIAWVAPTPLYLQAIAGIFDGDNDVAFGGGTLRDPLVTGRLRTFFEPTDTLAIQFGVSAMTGLTTEDKHASYGGIDAKFKYTPESWRHPLLDGRRRDLLRSPEQPRDAGLDGRRRGERGVDAETPAPGTDGAGVATEFEKRDAYGFYVWTEVQPWRPGYLGFATTGLRIRRWPDMNGRSAPTSASSRRSSCDFDWGTSIRNGPASDRPDIDRRAPVPGDVHPGRSPRRPLLGRLAMRRLFPGLARRWALVLVCVGLALASTTGPGALPAAGAARIRVVTSTTDLKALTEAVGGDRVEVDSLARGNQNPHDLEIRPSQMVKLRRADLVVLNGLELDGWAEVAIQGANNPRLIPGAPGRVDASIGIPVLEVPSGKVDRSMGDVHPAGNPHYTLDPGDGADHHDQHRRRARAGRARAAGRLRAGPAGIPRKLEPAMAAWAQTMAPFKGAKLVVDHSQWNYFFARYGLVLAGTVEERPGIPPAPGHLVRLAAQMKADGVKALILEPWGDRKLADRLAADTGARVVPLAPGAGAVKGTETYLDWMAYNVNTLAQALR